MKKTLKKPELQVKKNVELYHAEGNNCKCTSK
ncbi:unknown [Eubacterium sp. CAG:161]|nr:unknown [Eubacterium sp. CAG:161]